MAGYDETTGVGRLSILDAATGTVLRTADQGAGNAPIALAAGGEDRLVAIDATANGGYGTPIEHGGIRILDAASGRLLQVVPAAPVVPSAVVMVGRLAFLMDAGGRIHLLDVRSGRILRAIDTGTRE